MTAPKKTNLTHGYQITLTDMRRELSPIERFWSTVIHSSIVSTLGPILSQSILRPRPLLVGSWLALVALVAAYLLERLHGYAISGIEPLLGFASGWVLGLLYSIALVLKQHFRIQK